MKILADSNIFIDFWKKPDQHLIDVFTKEDVVICGIIRAELMHGAKSESDLQSICEVLNEFEQLTFEESDWISLGNYLNKLRANGITVPVQDAIISLIGIKYHIPVWTKDKHFTLIQQVMNDLQLYS